MSLRRGDRVRVARYEGNEDYDSMYVGLFGVVVTEEQFDVWVNFDNATGVTRIKRIHLEKVSKEPNEINIKGVNGKGDLSNKPHLAYLDPQLEYEAGLGMRFGITKHGLNNYREMGPEASQHVLDALKRHLNAYLRGEQTDSESKVNHLACVLNNLNFLYRLDRLHGYDAVLRNVYGETK